MSGRTARKVAPDDVDDQGTTTGRAGSKDRSKQTRYDTSKLALVYCRQSTKDQPIRNVEAALMQRDELVNYAIESYRWPEEKVLLFVENELDKFGNKLDKPRAASGRLDKNFRPGLLEVESLVEQDRAGAIFVRDISRLFRDEDMISPAPFAKMCKAHNVIIVTYDQEFDFNATSRDDLKDFLEEAQSAADFLKWQRRTLHKAKQRKGERGEYAGSSITTGYMLDEKRKFYIPCPVWSDTITWLFHRYRELDGSLYELYTEVRGTCLFPTLPDELLSRVGYIQLSPVKGGYTISSRTALKYILVNPTYLGHKVYRKRIVKYNAHLPLTTKDNFEYALARLGEVDLEGELIERKPRVKRFTQGAKREGLLAGVRSDGTPVITSTQGHINVFQYGGYVSYSIRDDRLGGKPYSGSISIDTIDALISTRLEEKLKQITWFAQVEKDLGGSPQYGSQAIVNHIVSMKKQLLGSVAKLDETIADVEKSIAKKQREYAIASDVMSDADIREHFTSLARLRSRLADLKEKRSQVAQVDSDIDTVQSRLASVSEKWEELTLEQKRSFIRLITESISLDALSDHWVKLTIMWSPVLVGENYTEYAVIFRTQGAGANWTADEESILYQMYPQASRSDILAALPHRAWMSIRFRATALKIKRLVKVRGEDVSPTLSLRDVAIIKEYGISEEQIELGECAWWTIVDTVRREDVFGS